MQDKIKKHGVILGTQIKPSKQLESFISNISKMYIKRRKVLLVPPRERHQWKR
jgi:hypothetical protein